MNECPQPGLHPDADTLNAFVEGVLPEHERLECLGHFADCAACREVVFLAQEPRAGVSVSAVDRVAWWKRWLKPIPVLSAAALAGVLVFSIALYRREKPAADAPGALVATSAETAPKTAAEPPHFTTPRAARKTQPNVPRSVSVQVPSKPEALLSISQPAPPDALSMGSIDAQTAVTGTITDPGGAPIAGAAVAVRQASGATGATAVTDHSGQFVIAGLQPGEYELRVTSSGFLPATKKVEIQPRQLARADSSLSVGSLAQTVQVTASAAVVDTQTQSLTTNLSATINEQLPGRTVANKSAAAVSDSVSLPGKLAAVATASKGKVMLAADSGGALYRSDNAGKKWKVVKPVWQGKVVELDAEPSAAVAAFRLKTDTGTAWLSRDGTHWFSAEPPKR